MKKIDGDKNIVLDTSWDSVPLHIDGVFFNLVRLQPYQRSLKQCRKLEPRLEAGSRAAWVRPAEGSAKAADSG